MMNDAYEKQPPPTSSKGDISKLVMEDIWSRREYGMRKYHTPLQAHNGRDVLIDMYQEALDMVCYMRQMIEERNNESSD